jgi:hypothetical protein
MNEQRTCDKCGKELRSAAALAQHVKDYHQPQAHVQYPPESAAAATTILSRLDDGFFHCLCGRKFRSPYRLQSHAKTCTGTDDSPPVAATTAMQSGAGVSLPQDCTDEDGLAEFGLLVNKQVKVIICSTCEYAVGADHLASHMRSHHKLVKLPEDFGHRLVEKYGVKKLPERPAVHDGGELEKAIGGLPVYPGFRCAMCVYFCKERTSMLKHIRRQHKDQDGDERRREDTEGEASPPSSSMTACLVQTIFTGVFTRYFGVLDDSQESAATDSVWAIVKRKLDEQDERLAAAAATAAAAGRLPNNRRLWSPFISKMRWDNILREEHSEDDHVRFAALPRGNGERSLKFLHQIAKDYFHLVSEEITSEPGLLRKQILALK